MQSSVTRQDNLTLLQIDESEIDYYASAKNSLLKTNQLKIYLNGQICTVIDVFILLVV